MGVGVAVAVGVLVGVDVAVGVAVGGGRPIELSAAPASTIPLPQIDVVQPLPIGKARAVFCRICRLCVKLSVGLIDSINDTTPTTCGVAMLVP